MHTFKTDERNRQEVIRGLRQKLELVEQAITNLTRSRKCVESNATMEKATVVQDISDVFTILRNREVNLLRQIDVMEARHLNILHTQYAEVHQILGNLKHVLYCVEQQEDGNSHTLSDSEMELVEMVLKQNMPTQPITYLRDIEELTATIQHFGAVATNLSTLQATKDLVSKCLPSKLEEYEDDDQQLLYKTLEEIVSKKEDGSKNCMKFPTLSDNKEDWLRENTSTKYHTALTKEEFCFPDSFLQTDCNYWLRQSSTCAKLPFQYPKEKKVEEWLRRQKNVEKNGFNGVKTEPAGEPLRDDQNSFVVSESIEMISHPETLTSEEFFYVPQKESLQSAADYDYFKFLKQPAQSNLWNSKEAIPNCCQADNLNVDIENLHIIHCAANGNGPRSDDRDKWLFRPTSCKRAVLERSFSEMLQLGGVCCANEPCSSWSDCVCKEECTRRASELQTTLDKNSVFHIAPKADEATWLRAYSGIDKKWHKSVDTCQAEKMDLSEKTLKEDVIDKSKYCFSLPFSNDKSSWLASNMLEQSKVDCDSRCIRPDFQSYFLPVNVNTWLVAAKD